MDIDLLSECLVKGNRTELGIPVVLPSFADKLQGIVKWALIGSPVEARQIWFAVGNPEDLQRSLPADVRNRIQPVHGSLVDSLMKRGPYDSLLLPIHGFQYSNPNYCLSEFWKKRGSYKRCDDFKAEDVTLWFWTSNRKPLKLFGIDHHHAVLWDAKQILKVLGAQLEFVWLCDGRPAVNEALPYQIPFFQSSLDIYRPPVDRPLPEETKAFLHSGHYDAVITSHSLVTCHRFKDLGLPMIHINSTRFGNDWIQDPVKHKALVDSIQGLLHTNKLRVIHNNRGDRDYFHQYFPYVQANQEVILPSLCENVLRLRTRAPPKKLLIWDTRQVLLQPNGSPFMKEMYMKLKAAFGDGVESQAILMAQVKSYLPEGYLDNYTAVIHIPYNISTMSMFQQVRSNIPIWIPSKQLLAKIWADPKEPNELSWTMFKEGSQATASPMDNARDPSVIQKWVSAADFYDPAVLPLALQFDSIEDLVEKAMTTDYQRLMDIAEETQQERRENIMFAWEQLLMSFDTEA